MGFSEITNFLEANAIIQIIAGLLSFICFSRIYFLFTRGTGKVIYLLSALFLSGILIILSNWAIFIFTILLGLLIVAELITRKSQISFDKVQATFEGGGIRRGLTPSEVAILFGKPFPQIVAINIIYLLEKNIIRLDSASYQILFVAEQLQTHTRSLSHKDRSEIRRNETQKLGIILHSYEEFFLELIEQGAGKPIKDYDFGILIKPWIESFSNRIGGYDIKQTREYYHQVIQKQKNISWALMRERRQEAIGRFDLYPDWLSGYEGIFWDWFEILEKDLNASIAGQDLTINLNLDPNKLASSLLDDIAEITYSVLRK